MTSLLDSIFGSDAPSSSSSNNLFESKTFLTPPDYHYRKDTDKSSESVKTKDKVTQHVTGSLLDTPPPSLDNATTKATSKRHKTEDQIAEEEQRTIFVGNLPPDITRRTLTGIFKSCGTVISARLRSVAVAGVKLPPEQAGNQNMMRKVCANTGKILSDTPKKSAQGYVVFQEMDSIKKALKLNNTIYQSHTIRVDYAKPTVEPSRSVFVGNLPYAADEESLRDHFLQSLMDGEDKNESDECAISGVRIIRDKETQRCKGFGYVALRDAILVPMALQLHGTTYLKKELRVMVCGKRFKTKQGDSNNNAATETATPTKNQSSKRKFDASIGPSSGKVGLKRRRSRGEKKGASQSGIAKISKRASTEAKVNRRVKKLQSRAAKGMGKRKRGM